MLASDVEGVPETTPVGIISMDWPGPVLIDAVILHNASVRPDLFGSGAAAAPELAATGRQQASGAFMLGMLLLACGLGVLVGRGRRRA